jgi:hypothetical protein
MLKVLDDLSWLVVSNMFYFPLIYGIILPIDSYFKRWFKLPTSECSMVDLLQTRQGKDW